MPRTPLLVMAAWLILSSCSSTATPVDTEQTEQTEQTSVTTTPALTTELAGRTFRGQFTEPEVSGTVAIVVSDTGGFVTSLVLKLELTNFDCQFGRTVTDTVEFFDYPVGDGHPIVGVTFQSDGGLFGTTWNGSFLAASVAEGTVSGGVRAGDGLPPCNFGPFSWRAES